MTRKEEIRLAGQTYMLSPNAYDSSKDIRQVVAECFIDGAEYADKTMVDKACKWLEENYWRICQYNPVREILELDKRGIEEFRNAMQQ